MLEIIEKRRDNKIDLEDFNLHDIGFLTNEKRQNRWEYIIELDISRNTLSNIDQIS